MDYSKLEDEVLIRLIAARSADSISELYDRYNRLIFSLALNIVGDRQTAEEITLDVFTRVWEKAEQYRPERAKVSTWLTKLTRNRSIDELRRRGSRPEQNSVDLFELSPSKIPLEDDFEEIANISFRRDRIRNAVSQLPEDQKVALQLAYFRGYTHRQIAETLDQPLKKVKTRIRLAMIKLRKLLTDEETGN